MRRYKIRCRYCIFYNIVNGFGYCDIFKIKVSENDSCEERRKRSED